MNSTPENTQLSLHFSCQIELPTGGVEREEGAGYEEASSTHR